MTILRGSIRLAIGLVAALALLLAAQFWFDPALQGARMGLYARDALGLATLRADNAGAFAAMGLLAGAAAIRGERRLLVAPLLFLVLALAGRAVTLAVSGLAPALLPPMVVEAVLVVLLAAGYRIFAAAA